MSATVAIVLATSLLSTLLTALLVAAPYAMRRDAAREAAWPHERVCAWPGAHRVAAMETEVYGTVLSTSVLLHLDGCRPAERRTLPAAGRRPPPPPGRGCTSAPTEIDAGAWVQTVDIRDWDKAVAELREKDRRVRALEDALDGIGRAPRSQMGRTLRDGLLEQKRRATRDAERLRTTFDDVVIVEEDTYLGDRLAFRAGQVVHRRDMEAFEHAAALAKQVGYREPGDPPTVPDWDLPPERDSR